ncbi:hypothetical protein Dsin_019680 [Dipteronia sinensis]|uniref:RRM domain-containing protein n=1 Tax=Dipteronia sinensis TaxID=43782 RepID=A0AAE0E490_9ROSI|nr:hypothetical protein Dsin_019680 [Dipteronia sinensis]
MSEKPRERKSGYGHHNGTRDFRDSLVSIFVDNLNPIVDSVCLCGVFKPFGRVRYVYLSSNNNGRRSRFAFIRFESLGEATKVARLTDGMHIYGWAVAVKVASHDWNRRRSSPVRPEGVKESHHRYVHGSAVDNRHQKPFHHRRTFANVLEGGKNGNILFKEKPEEKIVFMRWEGNRDENVWIDRCAVGVLKSFSNISSVNRKLIDRGLRFSSTYFGDKCIIWEFETVADCEGFILNSSYWVDCFSSMLRWTDLAVPKSRLVWVNCVGIPLRCWDEKFFRKIGWILGEPLMIENDTRTRNRLDRGGLLVLIPYGALNTYKIKFIEEIIWEPFIRSRKHLQDNSNMDGSNVLGCGNKKDEVLDHSDGSQARGEVSTDQATIGAKGDRPHAGGCTSGSLLDNVGDEEEPFFLKIVNAKQKGTIKGFT